MSEETFEPVGILYFLNCYKEKALELYSKINAKDMNLYLEMGKQAVYQFYLQLVALQLEQWNKIQKSFTAADREKLARYWNNFKTISVQVGLFLIASWIFFWKLMESVSALMLTFSRKYDENYATDRDALINKHNEELVQHFVNASQEGVEKVVDVLETLVESTTRTEPVEKITSEDSSRYFLYPIQYPELWKLYKDQMANFWTAEAIDFSEDVMEFEALPKEQQDVIKMVIALFVWADGVVNENISLNFINEITIPEAKFVYTFQEMMENIHNEVYSNMLNQLIRDEDEKAFLKDAIENIPSVKAIYQWITDWMNSTSDLATRLLIFSYFEGVLFSGMFAIIFWFKKNGKMKGIMQANNWISRDEGKHYETGCTLYCMLDNRLTQEQVHEHISKAVDVTTQFTNDILKIDIMDLSQANMRRYIEYITDNMLAGLGYAKLYGTANPFDYMEAISLYSKENFFERRGTQYQKAEVKNTNRTFGIEDDY